MSFWIKACCNESVASVTAEELAAGISERLSLLTYLFCPDEEEDPKVVLERLRIEDKSEEGTFRVFLMHYRSDSPTFIRVDRIGGAEVQSELEELNAEVLSRHSEPSVAQIQKMLALTKEQVTFCLKAHDVNSMGFPLSIAAAAYLVQKAGGIIQSGSYSWMVPSGREVKIILEIEA